MKQMYLCILAALAGILAFSGNVSAQTDKSKEPTMEELAAKEADRLAELLDLEDWQIFYVDSTLQHDYTAMKEELDALQKSRVDNYDLYTSVQDKWMDQVAKMFRKYFDDAQWAKYLKNGGGAKAQKARDKRRAEREKADIGKK